MITDNQTTTTETTTPAPAIQPTRWWGSLDDKIPGRLALGAAVSWVVLVWVVIASAGPADPEAPIRAFDVLLSTALWSTMLASAFGLAAKVRWGLAATGVGASLMLVGAVACFFGGHFGPGILQTGAAFGLGAVAVGGLRVS